MIKRHVFSVFVLLSAFRFCAQARCEESPDATDQSARREQLLALFKGDKVPPRVLEELALKGPQDPATRKALLAVLAEKSRNSNRVHYFIDFPIEIPDEIPFIVPYWLVDGFAGRAAGDSRPA